MKIPFVSNLLDSLDSAADIRSYEAVSNNFMYDIATSSGYDGDKFATGFGVTKDFQVVDLKTLQYRSIQLLTENVYAKAIFTRLETKVINSGLSLNAAPVHQILGSDFNLSDQDLREWARKTEARFNAWKQDKEYVSHSGDKDFADLEMMAYHTSLLSGDCLVEVTINKDGLPVIQLIDGFNVSNPFYTNKIKAGNKLIQGVELNKRGKEVAYWVENSEGGHTRINAYGRNSKRRRAWLVKSSRRRIDDVRGLPLLYVVMQNLNEASKLIDSEQRAAIVNSNLAMTRNRAEGQAPKNAGGRGSLGSTTVTNSDGKPLKFHNQLPGLYIANMQAGETVTSFDTKRPNVNVGPFLESIIKPIAYSLEIPPEVLFLEYGSNFSASRQAKLDLNDFLTKEIRFFSSQFNTPVYVEWLTGEILNGDIKAPGYLNSLINLNQWDIRNAWRNAMWRGLPNTSVDFKKQLEGLVIAEKHGWLTSEQITAQYFNGDWFDNVRRKKTEVELLVESEEALVVLSELVVSKEGKGLGAKLGVDFVKQFIEMKKLVETFHDRFEEIEQDLEDK